MPAPPTSAVVCTCCARGPARQTRVSDSRWRAGPVQPHSPARAACPSHGERATQAASLARATAIRSRLQLPYQRTRSSRLSRARRPARLNSRLSPVTRQVRPPPFLAVLLCSSLAARSLHLGNRQSQPNPSTARRKALETVSLPDSFCIPNHTRAFTRRLTDLTQLHRLRTATITSATICKPRLSPAAQHCVSYTATYRTRLLRISSIHLFLFHRIALALRTCPKYMIPANLTQCRRTSAVASSRNPLSRVCALAQHCP